MIEKVRIDPPELPFIMPEGTIIKYKDTNYTLLSASSGGFIPIDINPQYIAVHFDCTDKVKFIDSLEENTSILFIYVNSALNTIVREAKIIHVFKNMGIDAILRFTK